MAEINWSSATTLWENSCGNLSCCQIDDYIVAVVYRIGTNQYIDIIEFDYYGNFEVLSHNVTASNLNLASDNVQAICKVTTNKFVVAAKHSNLDVNFYYWDGVDLISYGDDLGSSADSDYHSLTQIEDNKVMLFYRSGGASLKAVVATCNYGDSLTWGSTYTIASYSASYVASTKIDSGKAFCAFRHTVADDLEVMVLSSPSGLSDRTISYGSKYDIETNKDTFYMSTYSYETDKAVVCYGISGASYGYAVACSISGTVVSIGTIKVFETGETTNTSLCKCLDVEDAFLVAYEDVDDSSKGKTVELIVDWDTKVITLGDSQTFSENAVSGGWDYRALNIINTTTDKYFIGYGDVTDGRYPKCIMDYISLLLPPSDISVEVGEGENTITFTPEDGATYTHIYWANSPGVTKETGTKISDVSSPYVHDSLNPSLTYYYVLTSENGVAEEGDESSEYSGSPYPEAPTNVTPVSSVEQITISWDSVLGADSYNIYWDSTSGVTKDTGTKITGVTSPYTHSSLIPGQTYYYVVTAEDEDGESSESSEVDEIPGLSIPSNISAYMSGSLKITITWDPCVGATTYNIYWAKSSGVTKETGTKISDVSSPYVHSGLDTEDTYYYVVTAENEVIESDESEEASDTAYLLPVDPIYVDATSSLYSNIVSWDSTGEGRFNIYWDSTSGVTKETGTKISNVTSPYTHYTPSHLIPFYYVVTGYSGSYETDESEEVSATPYIEEYTYPDQDRSIDAFSDGRFSSSMNKVVKMVTLNDMVLFPEQTFKMDIDSTSEITIGEGIFIKDNILVHIQESYQLDFSDNDYYIDSTGDMDEEGYYYIVIKYDYKRQRPGPKASFYIIRDTSLYDSSIHIFLGTAKISDSGESYIIENIYTYDPSDETVRRPTIPNAGFMTIDAGEL
jgi:hypothetical protein